MSYPKVFPIKAGLKTPALSESWKTVASNDRYQVQDWLVQGYWLGLPCGVINGGLEVLDVDDPELVKPVGGAVLALFRNWEKEPCLVQTRKGLHVYFRSTACGPNQKLAVAKSGNTRIETRGEGGYVVTISGNNKIYKATHGTPEEIPVITLEQREQLLDLAREHNEVFTEAYVPQEYTDKGRPGDDFNKKGEWAAILQDWTKVRTKGEYTEWRRPGKETGSISATTGHEGRDIMYLFSSNVPGMEPNKAYTKFSAYAYLEHEGSFEKAAKALAEKGFGNQKKGVKDPLAFLYKLANEYRRYGDPLGNVWVKDGKGRAMKVTSDRFKQLLDFEHLEATGSFPRETYLTEIITKLNRMPHEEIDPLPVRVWWKDIANLWLDMGQQYIHLTPNGWHLRDESPVLFYPMVMPQVTPTPSQDNLDSLREFVNLESENDWICFQAWLLGLFMNYGTYPIMVLHGGEGSAKSFMSKLCRRIIDPSVPELAQYPRKMEDIDVAASSQFLLIYDNLSSINLTLSDMFCSLVTGTGIIKRELYSNEKPFVRQWKRPVIVNGIDPSLARRQDFASRALLFDLPQIAAEDRIREEVMWPKIDDLLPVWLGSILNALVHGLRQDKEVQVGLRLIDFATWAVKCLPYFGYTEEQILTALMENRKKTQIMLIEADLVTAEILRLMETNPVIESVSTTALYTMLTERLNDKDAASRDWPKSSVQFGIQLKRATTSLYQMGIIVTRERGRDGTAFTIAKVTS